MPDRTKSKKDRDPPGQSHRASSYLQDSDSLGSSPSSSTSTISTPVIPHRTQYSLILVLTPLNGTFERKTLVLPFYPDVLKLGRQTSPKNSPSSENGFFDSRVLSRSHAEVWADRATGKVWIKDSKSSNGTYINGFRLGNEKSESEPYELKKNDTLELGIDITNDERTTFVHRKISARVERIAMMSLQTQHENSFTGNPNAFAKGSAGPNGYRSFGQANGSTNNMPGYHPNVPINTSGPTSAESLDVTLFGEIDASLEDLSLSHTRNSVSGIFMKSGITSSVLLEQIVKSLVTEIHHAKVEKAKIQSVSKLLEEISANQHESKTLTEQLPTLELYKSQTDTLAAELEQARQELAFKDERIAEMELDLQNQRAANAKLQDELNHMLSAISFKDEKASELPSSNELTKKDTSFNSNDNTNNEIKSEHLKDTETDKKLTVDCSRQQESAYPLEKSVKRPTSPDLYSDPIHQLSQPSDISVLNLNSSQPSSHFSPSIRPLGSSAASPFGHSNPFSSESYAIESDSNNANKYGSIDSLSKARNFSENDDRSSYKPPKSFESGDGDEIKDENSTTGKHFGDMASHKSLSVPSTSPPSSPRGALAEIRSLPQSPRALLTSGFSASTANGTGSPLAASLSPSYSHFPHTNSAGTSHIHPNRSSLSPNLQSLGISSNSSSTKLSTRTSSSSLQANNQKHDSRRSSNSSNRSASHQSSIHVTNKRRSIHKNHSSDDIDIASESEDDLNGATELKGQVKKLTEELEAARCEMELLRNRAATAERVAIERFRMTRESDLAAAAAAAAASSSSSSSSSSLASSPAIGAEGAENITDTEPDGTEEKNGQKEDLPENEKNLEDGDDKPSSSSSAKLLTEEPFTAKPSEKLVPTKPAGKKGSNGGGPSVNSKSIKTPVHKSRKGRHHGDAADKRKQNKRKLAAVAASRSGKHTGASSQLKERLVNNPVVTVGVAVISITIMVWMTTMGSGNK